MEFSTSLYEAQQAAQTLNDLQSKAAQLPKLQHEHARNESLARLNSLREKTQSDISAGVSELVQLENEFEQQLEALQVQMIEAHKLLMQIQQKRADTLALRSRYIAHRQKHYIEHEGLDAKNLPELLMIETQCDSDLNIRYNFQSCFTIEGQPLRNMIMDILFKS